MVKLPNDMAFPVDLHQIDLVLMAVGYGALAQRTHHIAAGQQFIGKALQFVPEVDHAAVHIHQDGAVFVRLKDGVAVKALVRQINRNACGVNSWIAHD